MSPELGTDKAFPALHSPYAPFPSGSFAKRLLGHQHRTEAETAISHYNLPSLASENGELCWGRGGAEKEEAWGWGADPPQAPPLATMTPPHFPTLKTLQSAQWGSSGPSACRLTLENTTSSLISPCLWVSETAAMMLGTAQRSLPRHQVKWTY